MAQKRRHVVEAVHAPGLALHVGQTAHEDGVGAVVFAGAGVLYRLDHAGHEQVGDDGGEQRARPQDDEVGLAYGVEGGRVGGRVCRRQGHVAHGGGRVAYAGLAFEHLALRRHARQRDVGQRRGVDMPARVEQALAHAYGVGKRSGLGGHGREDEVSQRVVVEVVEAVPEGARHDAVVVGRHGAYALAHVSRGDHAAARAQDARRAAVVYHRDDRGHVAAHVEQGAYGDGRAGAPAYDDRLHPAHRATPCASEMSRCVVTTW